MLKRELRSFYRKRRIALPEGECQLLSNQLCDLFFEFVDLENLREVNTFLSIKRNNEPDTWIIIHRLKERYPEMRISVPRINKADKIDPYYLNANELEENKWGIPEPTHGNQASVGEIDLVIVPLLVADKKGNRVGYGKGHYDRFLQECKADCIKVGLSFFDLIDEVSDANEMDVPLDVCITPKKAYTFKD